MTPKQQRQFDTAWEELDRNFDWDRVQSVMNFFNWEWCDTGVPDVSALKQTAQRLLQSLIEARDDVTGTGTGGFFVVRCGENGFELRFELCSWETE